MRVSASLAKRYFWVSTSTSATPSPSSVSAASSESHSWLLSLISAACTSPGGCSPPMKGTESGSEGQMRAGSLAVFRGDFHQDVEHGACGRRPLRPLQRRRADIAHRRVGAEVADDQ